MKWTDRKIPDCALERAFYGDIEGACFTELCFGEMHDRTLHHWTNKNKGVCIDYVAAIISVVLRVLYNRSIGRIGNSSSVVMSLVMCHWPVSSENMSGAYS